MKTILLLLPWFAMNAVADVPADQLKEVEHLVNYIRSTDCRLERNDRIYSAREALEHILKKYDYYRDEISSTEDFIEYSASKSVMSGKSYITRCEGYEPVPSRQWLLTELKRYRESVDSVNP